MKLSMTPGTGIALDASFSAAADMLMEDSPGLEIIAGFTILVFEKFAGVLKELFA